MSELTSKQSRFVEEYCSNGFNATQAAISAGYKPDNAKQTACENLAKPYLQEAIQVFMNKATEKALVTTESLVEKLLAEAEYNGEGASHSARISALKTLTDYTGGFDKNKQTLDHKSSDKSMTPKSALPVSEEALNRIIDKL